MHGTFTFCSYRMVIYIIRKGVLPRSLEKLLTPHANCFALAQYNARRAWMRSKRQSDRVDRTENVQQHFYCRKGVNPILLWRTAHQVLCVLCSFSCTYNVFALLFRCIREWQNNGTFLFRPFLPIFSNFAMVDGVDQSNSLPHSCMCSSRNSNERMRMNRIHGWTLRERCTKIKLKDKVSDRVRNCRK